jgi:tRNA uridine 5-carbamoylmethylation protein Kti12
MKGSLTLKKTSKSTLFSNYDLEKKLLCPFNKKTGSPSQRAAHDEHGNSVIIKTWPRNPDIDDKDLHDIWRNETRQLYRLAGYPGTSNYIADLRAAIIDEHGYYLIINSDQRRPLESLIREETYKPIKNAKSTKNRRLAWGNLLRLAKGLEILHLQGLLHRNLNTWSILTAGTEEPDFQLTGFEWSMRLTEPEQNLNKKNPPESFDNTHSFIKDWQQLGEVSAILLGIPYTKLANLKILNHDISDAISSEEIRLIRELQGFIRVDRIDGKYIITKIEKILLELESTVQNQEQLFGVIFSVGSTSRTSGTIRTASKQMIDIDDEIEQIKFIKRDLRSPVFQVMKASASITGYKLSLRGDLLTYTIDAYRKAGTPTWDFAYCTSAELTSKVPNPIFYQIPLNGNALHILTRSEMKNSARLRGRVTSWESLKNKATTLDDTLPPDTLMRKSLILSQIIDYLFAASEVYPVEIIASNNSNYSTLNDGTLNITVCCRSDSEREKFCDSLNLKDNLAKRLEKSLTEDNFEYRANNWLLTDSPIIGERSVTDTEWQFNSCAVDKNGRNTFKFIGDTPPPNSGQFFLISGDSSGRDLQLRRRLKSFNALAEHHELSKMIYDPRGRIMSSHEQVIEDQGFKSLDDSKQQAFQSIIETLPLFLVQGPPGVGKTRLVRELVKQILNNDKSARLLLSAQSNYAVDHLVHEIKEIISDDSDAIIIRCVQKTAKDAEKRFDIGYETKCIIQRLINSDLASSAPPFLSEKLSHIYSSYDSQLDTPIANGTEASKRSMESLVLRAANLVFATTNSADLENLIEEKSQFDWSIIEEAGKATGGELTSPLLLSPRRLMIGDHKQLPPYGAERILRILSNPLDTKKALDYGNSMIGKFFRDPIVDEIFSDARTEDSTEDAGAGFPELCDEARRNFLLFESIIENEFERQSRNNRGIPIAKALYKQHRMHPAIADVVSHAFYKGKLLTDDEAILRFGSMQSPVMHTHAHIPDTPITWINMPWVSDTIGMKEGECSPRYTNEGEIKAVEEIIKQLKTTNAQDKKPSLAVLSPYSRQTRKLAELLESKRSTTLKNLDNFSSSTEDDTFCKTVDSFQGNEADCIIISLVRNNSHSTISNSLGFLSDARRMNVLMSRAKWRLIIIGSLDFLRSVNNQPKNNADKIQIDFLSRLLEKFENTEQNQFIKVVNASTALGTCS